MAVKVVEHGPESQALLDREATLATSICHPNLVATYRYSTYASSRHLESSQGAVRESEPVSFPHPKITSVCSLVERVAFYYSIIPLWIFDVRFGLV